MLKVLKFVIFILQAIAKAQEKSKFSAMYVDSEHIISVEFWRF